MARTALAPGETGNITITAYDKGGEVLKRGNITRQIKGAVQYQARARAGVAEGDTRQVQGTKALTVTRAKEALQRRVDELVAAAQDEAEAKAHAGVPREWTAFARNHRAYVLSDDADYSDGSQRVYREALDLHFLGADHRFAGRRLDSITHGELRDWLQDLANVKGDGAAHTARSLVGKMYRRALSYGIVTADPAARLGKIKRSRRTAERLQAEAELEAARNGTEVTTPRDHQRALTAEDLGRLFSFLSTDKVAKRNGLELLALTMFGSGLRIGELLALRGEEQTLTGDSPFLVIRATAVRVPGVGLVLQPWTKTTQGMRRVPIAPSLANRLASHWEEDRRRAELEEAWNPLGLLFPSERGTIRDSSNTTRKFRHAFDHKDVGLSWATPHVFRRTFATMYLARGMSPVGVAALLGHTDPSFTLKTYGDWTTAPEVESTVLEGLYSLTTTSKALTKA